MLGGVCFYYVVFDFIVCFFCLFNCLFFAFLQVSSWTFTVFAMRFYVRSCRRLLWFISSEKVFTCEHHIRKCVFVHERDLIHMWTSHVNITYHRHMLASHMEITYEYHRIPCSCKGGPPSRRPMPEKHMWNMSGQMNIYAKRVNYVCGC